METDPFPLIPAAAVMIGLGLVVFVVVTTTSFVKIAVVLFIVRNAIGVQQTPPNIVLYGIALALSAFVMAPILSQVAEAVEMSGGDFATFGAWRDAIDMGQQPIRDFLMNHTNEQSRMFFVAATAELWPDPERAPATQSDIGVLIPAFMTAELERAFEIGFLLYLPFIVIDLVVTTILMAMGMSMVTPTIIATPMKLFLFVAISGWTQLVQGLVLSYAT